mmetsp:Transcript_82865/g.160150  ORF Transcript_82865/g.160150 Transcript_82865/m.160150 type:complete len:81 (+) Transcript_82865:509-751(+)
MRHGCKCLAEVLFLLHVSSDLLRSVDTDFLNFPANRAIERLAPSLGPPFCDAVCMEFMFTRGPTTRIRCSDLRQTDCTNV